MKILTRIARPGQDKRPSSERQGERWGVLRSLFIMPSLNKMKQNKQNKSKLLADCKNLGMGKTKLISPNRRVGSVSPALVRRKSFTLPDSVCPAPGE